MRGKTWLYDRPWLVLLAASAVTAIAFPGVGAGAIALVFLCGGAGVLAVAGWPLLPERVRRPPATVAGWLAILAVIVAGCVVFRWVFAHRLGYLWGDWGPQREILTSIIPGLRDGDVPTWNHRIATGDAPLDLYPAAAYYVTGKVAIAAGWTDDLMRALMIVAIATHILLCVQVTRLALRVAPAPLAALVGLFCLVDLGEVNSGGVNAILGWALMHSALGQLFAMHAAIAVVDALERPRLSRSVAIWVFTALATATHPASLLLAGVMIVALGAVALLARDVPPRRALAAAFHVVLGVALGAIVWMPFGERVLLYGEHFSYPMVDPGLWIAERIGNPVPEGSFPLLTFLGFVGILVGVWSRRAVTVFIGAAGLVCIIALCDAAYLGFDLAPSPMVARLGVARFSALARPFVFASAAYVVGLLGAYVLGAWRSATPRARLGAGAVLGVMVAFTARGCAMYDARLIESASSAAVRTAPPEDDERDPLIPYLRSEVAAAGPSRFGRALFDEAAWYLHISADTGVAAFNMDSIPDVFNRERIRALTPESIRRFNVRWVIAHGRPAAADLPGVAGTDRQIGAYYVREVPDWDGKFARIERGSGNVVVTRLDDHAVDVEVTGTDKPVLVALGMGYYPRWRAHHESGSRPRVYAYPATSAPDEAAHVPAAWLPPGRTRFTCDAPLPSDGKGRPFAFVALLLAALITVGWSVPRARRRILVTMSRTRRAILARRRAIVFGACTITAVALVTAGAITASRPVRSVEVGSGVRALATVESRPPGAQTWKSCPYSPLAGEFQCVTTTVGDGSAVILNDAQLRWPFTAPAILIRRTPRGGGEVEVRIRMRRYLEGTYWIGSVGDGAPATIEIEGEAPFTTARQVEKSFEKGSDRDIAITGLVPEGGLWIAFTRRDMLEPARTYLEPPPDMP